MTHEALTPPLATTLARVSETSAYLKTQFGAPQTPGWHCPAAVYASGSAALAEQIAKTQARLRTSAPIIVGGSLLQGYQWPLIHAVVGCYIADQRVPDVRPEEVWVHAKIDAEHDDEIDRVALASERFWALPDDEAADHPDVTIVPDQAALRDALREMITAYFAPAVALLCAELGCKERALWLFVADGLASTLAWTQIEQLLPASRAEVEAELDGLVRVSASPLFAKQIGLFELTVRDQLRLQYDRATCCYWYKTADANGDCCTTCPRRPAAERDALLLKYLEAEEAERVKGQAAHVEVPA